MTKPFLATYHCERSSIHVVYKQENSTGCPLVIHSVLCCMDFVNLSLTTLHIGMIEIALLYSYMKVSRSTLFPCTKLRGVHFSEVRNVSFHG